jgi:3-hydroxyisobutyrate dehydrogenase-like beta-hydroxyacid dehydrogenase
MSPPNGVEVAVLGLGRMGSAIAERLVRAGHSVRVWNRTAAKADPLVAAGATRSATPAAAAAGAQLVISSMLDDASLHELVEAPDGVLAGLGVGAVHVSTATVSPGCSNAIATLHAARGQDFLAAPVVGRPEVARAGELLSLVGGPAHVIERARPSIAAYSARILTTGPEPGTANSLKLAVNFYIASIAELFGEVLAFAEKSGVDHETTMQTLRGMQGAPGVAGYLERIGARDLDDAGFAMATGLKDLGLIADAAAAVRCPLPFAAVARDRTMTAIATGLRDKDWSAFTEITRLNAGLA